MIHFFSLTLAVIYGAIMIFGLVQCRKHSFKGGFYFFLFLIIEKIFSYVLSNYVVSINYDNRPFGMTIGELVASVSLLLRLMEIIAFGFLATGLYQYWRYIPKDRGSI